MKRGHAGGGGGGIAGAIRLAACVWLAAAAAACRVWAGPAGAETDAMTAGRAALEDGLYTLAEQQFRAGLEALGAGGDPSPWAAGLMQALHGQDRHREVLDVEARYAPAQKQAAADGMLFWAALALHHLGEHAQALERVEAFESRYPESRLAPDVCRLRAWCYRKLGRKAEALACFSDFAQRYPAAPEAQVNRLEWGRALLEDGDGAAAERVLRPLLEPGGDPAVIEQGRLSLGDVLLAREAWTEARDVLAVLTTNTAVRADIRARAAMRLGVAYEGLTNDTESVAMLRLGHELAPSPALKRRGGFLLGEKLLRMGQMDKGVPLLKALIAEAPGDAASEAVQLELAQALLDRGRAVEAADEFQHYLETFTNTTGRARALEGRGWALMQDGRYAEAATAFGKASEGYTNDARRAACRFKMGDAYFANGQFNLAADVYAGLAEAFPDADLLPQALYQLGESLTRAGKTADALETFQRLADRYAADPYAETAMLRMASIHEQAQRWEEALSVLDTMMNAYSNSTHMAEALQARGMVKFRLFRFSEALEDFERIVREFGEGEVGEHAYYQRGMCKYWMGRDEEALDICMRFLETFPDSRWAPGVRFWLGTFHHNAGRFEKAMELFLSFADRYPSHALADDAVLWAGICAARNKDYLGSIELLNRLVKEYPGSEKLAEARFAQADSLTQLARYAAAILIYDEIIAKYPGRELVPAAWGRKGDCQFTLGAEDPSRYRESMESYRVVVNNARADVELVLQAEYKIGRCHEKLGRPMEAFEHYYLRVLLPFLQRQEAGEWIGDAAKVWFTRAAFAAAAIMEQQEDWRRAVSILKRVVDAEVPAADEARERIRRIRSERWWLF